MNEEDTVRRAMLHSIQSEMKRFHVHKVQNVRFPESALLQRIKWYARIAHIPTAHPDTHTRCTHIKSCTALRNGNSGTKQRDFRENAIKSRFARCERGTHSKWFRSQLHATNSVDFGARTKDNRIYLRRVEERWPS